MPARKYALDTHLFIAGLRDRQAYEALQRFHFAFAPFEHLSAVVAQELCAGVRSLAQRRDLTRLILAPFEKTGRLFAPSKMVWLESGDVLAELADRHGLETSKVSKSFGNDVLLALSCREAGVVLVTDNLRDFGRIAAVRPFDFVPPWPGPPSRSPPRGR